jgi:hypothetical protein
MSRVDLHRRIKLRGSTAVLASVSDLENLVTAIGPPPAVAPSPTNIGGPSDLASTYKSNNGHRAIQFPHTPEPAA